MSQLRLLSPDQLKLGDAATIRMMQVIVIVRPVHVCPVAVVVCIVLVHLIIHEGTKCMFTLLLRRD